MTDMCRIANTSVTSRNFFIDEILKPDFGRDAILKRHQQRVAVSSKRNAARRNSVNTLSPLSPASSVASSLDDVLSDGCGSCNVTYENNRKSTYQRTASPPCSSPWGITGRTSRISSCSSSSPSSSDSSEMHQQQPAVASSTSSSSSLNPLPWPAWVYCTRYSDRPSAGQ